MATSPIQLDETLSSAAPQAAPSGPAIQMDETLDDGTRNNPFEEPSSRASASDQIDDLTSGGLNNTAVRPYFDRKPVSLGPVPHVQSAGGEEMEREQGAGGYVLDDTLKPRQPGPLTIGDEVSRRHAVLHPVSTDLPAGSAMPDEPVENADFNTWVSALPGARDVTRSELAKDQQFAGRLRGIVGETPDEKLLKLGAQVAGGPGEFYRGTGEIANAIDNLDEAAPGQRVRQAAQGATETMKGIMDAGLPAFGSAVLQQPLKLAMGVAAGYAGGWTAQKAAQLAGAPPEVQEFAKTAGFFFPAALATLSGLQASKGALPGVEGEGAAVSALGGRVQAGVGRTPEAYSAGVRVAGKQVSVNIARGPQPEAPAQLPSPQEITATEQQSNAVSTAAASSALDQAASRMAAGIPPPQPPKPPMPDGMDQKTLTKQTLMTAAKVVQLAPPEARSQMLLEAHQNLAAWIWKQGGTIIGPDDMVHTIDSPKKAQALAEKFINDTIQEHQNNIQAMKDERQRQIDEQQKAAEKQAAEQQKAAEKKAADEEKAGIDTSPEMRTKTILDSNQEVQGEDRVNLVQRQLGVPRDMANDLVQNYDNPTEPTVGGPGHEVLEEPRSTVDAQMQALQNGTTKVVMLPEGSTYKPAIPNGFKSIELKGDIPGAGTYIYDPTRIRAATIKEAAKAGTHGDLMGHIQTKEEVEQAAQPAIVTARDPNTGVAIQDSAVDASKPGAVETQAQVLQERHPGANMHVGQADDVLRERAAQQREEESGVPSIQMDETLEKPAEQEHKYSFGSTQHTISDPEVNATIEGGEGRLIVHEPRTGGKTVIPEASNENTMPREYEAQVRKYAGDPKPVRSVVTALNRRQAETLFAEKHHGMHISDIGRVEEKPESSAVAASKKGDRVTAVDNKGEERAGTVAYQDQRITRIKTDDGSEITVKNEKVLPEVVQSSGKKEMMENPPEPGEVSQGASPEGLAGHLLERLRAGQMPENNNQLKKIVFEYDKRIVTDKRMKEAQEALEHAIVLHARDIVAQGASPRATFSKLLKLYEAQPNLNIRTSTSMANQAYSTPAPLAYVASQLAGITPNSEVYEPTAGNGMLLIAANPEHTQANELNPDRAAALKQQGFQVTGKDATATNVAPAKQSDVVIANPPFGSIKENGSTAKVAVDGYKIGQIDHLIAARALDAMRQDGRAVLILGASKVAGGMNTDDRIFFNWLYSHYNVVSHFEVDGDLYARQGAGWPVRVITIDGRQESDAHSPQEGTIQRVKSWEDVYGQLSDRLAAAKPENRDQQPGGAVQRSGESSEPPAVRADAGKSADRIGGSGPEAGKAGAVSERGAPADAVRNSDGERSPSVPITDPELRPDADVARSNKLERGRPDPEPRQERPPVALGDQRNDPLVSADNEYQVKYTPASSKKDEGVLIPTNMRGPLKQAMNRLEDEVGDIDEFVRSELGYSTKDEMHDVLMGLQVDSVAAAIHQIKRGKAVIIGDQTGIGKGRQAAAIIRWAARNGHIPTFVTVKPQLFTDMYGDLADIGTDDINPFLMNREESITLPDGSKAFANKQSTHTKTLEKIRDSGQLPAGSNAMFLTYSQINKANTQQQVLSSIAHRAVFVLDESHNAGGESETGEFVQGLLANAKGVTYLSATYAKRPDNMPVYFKTDIGLVSKDREALSDAMAAGGLPLQTVVSNNLVKAGQFFRRERSYDGVEMRTETDSERRAEHTQMSDKATEALRAIVKADKAFHNGFVNQMQKEAAKTGQAVEGGGNKAANTVQHSEFSSIVHNFVRQMLLGLKADSAADRAIEAIKRGEKPIIAVENTMGSFLQRYVEDNGLKEGDPLTNYDYRTVLSNSLKKTRYITIKDQKGNETKKYISLNDLDAETRAEYDKAQAVIDKLKLDIPVSPIDWMRWRIEQAGHSVSEVTGRSLMVDYTEDIPRLASIPEQELDRVLTTRRFNDGRLDALVVNVAGSTGISLHASEKFKDQRPRHMVVAQPAQDINIFMQMLGRIHRTGQVRLPSYTILSVDLPAEKRPTALLSKKMKSLNANTSSNTESATSVKAADILNKYGDEIVNTYLNDNPELEKKLGIEGSGDHNAPEDDLARKVTGKLALLPVKDQTAFYNDVEQAYNDYIDYLNETNQNELEPRTMDFDAKETKSQQLTEATDRSSPFGQESVYGEYSIKSQGKPLTADEVAEKIKKSLDGAASGQQHAQRMQADLDKQYADWKATLDPESTTFQRADGVANMTRQFLKQHPIGSTMRVEINGDGYRAAIVNVESTHKGSGNPYSFSKINVTLATDGSLRFQKVPATQLSRIQTGYLHYRPEEIFRNLQPQGRETAKIITGNLLAAYSELQGTKGSIINFTKADGSTEMGILLPKKFEIKENTRGDYRMRTPQQIAKYLNAVPSQEAATMGVASRDGDVRIVRNGNTGDLLIVTHKSKARGAQFFLDEKLRSIVGDFVSHGNTMRAEIPKNKLNEAITAVQNKKALYAPPSQVEIARQFEPKDEGKKALESKPNPKTSTTMRASVFGLDIAAEAGYKVASAFYKADVAPALEKLGTGVVAAGKQITNLLYPRIGVNADSLDAFFDAKGMREEHRFLLEHVNGGLEKFMDKIGDAANIEFMDRKRQGMRQQTPELQQISDLMDEIGNRSFAMVQTYRPSLEAKENYYGAIWKVIPGSGKVKGGGTSGKRPFEGAKQFFKQQTLATISEGLENGGELPTLNAWKLFSMVEASKMHYIAAQKYWASLKELGLRKFVKTGTKPPEGWTKVDDRIAKVYFPAASGEGRIDAGEWYVEQGSARILNNYLSRDHIRDQAIGKGMLMLKNFATGVEMGLSPFHLLFESNEAIGSQLATGIMRAWNIGVRSGNFNQFIKGMTEASTSIAAPFMLARDGGSYLKAISNAEQFAQTKRGTRFFQKYPDVLDGIVFKGGAQFNMNPDYKFDPVKGIKEAAKEGNYVGAALRLLPAAESWMMKPLFDVFIPRLKLGFFLKQFAEQMDERAQDLIDGKTTRLEIARKVNDTTENRFGEMNFDNVVWNNTFKSAMQFLFRSVTWKLGNWRGLVTAAGSETAEAFRDPLAAMFNDAKNWKRPEGRTNADYIPRLGMNQAWLLSMAITSVITGTLISKIFSGKYPWEWLTQDERNGYSAAGAFLLESIHPRTGRMDARTGIPDRVNLPSGLRDFEHAYRDPAGYMKGSLSQVSSRFLDLANNRDFFGNYVYDPNAPLYQQVAQAAKYAIPEPIALSSLQNNYGSQDAVSKTLRVAGLGGASKSLDQSPLLQRMLKMKRDRHDPLTPDQVALYDRDRTIGHRSLAQLRTAMRERNMDYVEKLALSPDFSYIQLREMVEKYATPREKAELAPILAKKRASLIRRQGASAVQ
jgi:hypothetical protein